MQEGTATTSLAARERAKVHLDRPVKRTSLQPDRGVGVGI